MILNEWLISVKSKNQDLHKHWRKTNNKNQKWKKKKIIPVKSKDSLKYSLVLQIHPYQPIKSMLDQNKLKLLTQRSFVDKTSHSSTFRLWEIQFSHMKTIIPYSIPSTGGNSWQSWIR